MKHPHAMEVQHDLHHLKVLQLTAGETLKKHQKVVGFPKGKLCQGLTYSVDGWVGFGFKEPQSCFSNQVSEFLSVINSS